MNESVQGEVFDFLFDLQESGKTNMLGAKPYVKAEFPNLTDKEIGEYIVYWMTNYEDLEKSRNE